MTTVVLEAVGVGHINSGSPTATSDDNDRTSFFATGEFGGSQLNRAWLMFDIWHVPSDAVVSAASLDLTVDTNFLGASHTLSAYRLRRRAWQGMNDTSGATAGHPKPKCSWDNYDQANTLAWSTAGAANTTTDRESAALGTSASLTSATTGTVTIAFDATMVQEWLSGAFTNHGLLLQASVETASSNSLIRWKTIDAATAAQRPRLSITYTSATEALAITDGVVAHYKLSDTSDATANAHTLTNNNATTFIAGKVGNAAHFVAASSQSLSNNDAALKPGATDDWTCCFWAKLTDLASLYTPVSQWRDVNAGDNLGSGWRIFYHQQSILDYYVAQLNDAGGTAEVCDIVGYSSGALGAAGTWIMVCVRHDAARKLLHLGFNNQMAKANSSASHAAAEGWGPYTATYIPATSAFRIGAQTSTGTGTSQHFNGDVDALIYWDRWVTDAQITAYYNGGAGEELTFTRLSSVAPNAGGTGVLPLSVGRVDFVGLGTTWTGGAPTITADVGSLGSLTVDTDTTAHATYTAPGTTGTATFTDSTDGSTTATLPILSAAVTAGSPAVAGEQARAFAIAGSGTVWIDGTTTFSVSGVAGWTVVSTAIDDGTQVATVTVSAPSATDVAVGTLTFSNSTDNADNATATVVARGGAGGGGRRQFQ